MKNLFLALILSAFTSQAMAHEFYITFLAPIAFTERMDRCENHGDSSACFDAMIAGVVSVTSTAFAIGLALKEEVAQVEMDAYNFLAGEEMSLALEQVMTKLRQENEGLNALSDLELAQAMVKSI